MSRGMKIGLIVVGIAAAAGGGVAYQVHKKKTAGTEVRMEKVARRDLVSAVTASGKIEAKTSVDISADITGRIIRLASRSFESRAPSPRLRGFAAMARQAEPRVNQSIRSTSGHRRVTLANQRPISAAGLGT